MECTMHTLGVNVPKGATIVQAYYGDGNNLWRGSDSSRWLHGDVTDQMRHMLTHSEHEIEIKSETFEVDDPAPGKPKYLVVDFTDPRTNEYIVWVCHENGKIHGTMSIPAFATIERALYTDGSNIRDDNSGVAVTEQVQRLASADVVFRASTFSSWFDGKNVLAVHMIL
eukprot:COSAG05_NODE_8567_length_692_cov_1.414840_1_plen_169_part_00